MYICNTCGKDWPTDYCPECAHTIVAVPRGEGSLNNKGVNQKTNGLASGPKVPDTIDFTKLPGILNVPSEHREATMEDSFRREFDEIKAQIPTTVKDDPQSLLYGGLFVFLGVWLVNLEARGLGIVMISVGVIGTLTGVATFVWKSPKVKVIQAINSFLALLLLVPLTTRDRHGAIIGNPLVFLGLAGLMVWSGIHDISEYSRLRKIENERSQVK